MSIPVSVVPPSDGWAPAFAAEAAALAAVLDGQGFQLHHIGSTAIRGIWAKPIIDMLLVMPSLADLDASAGRLIAAGYEAKGEFGIPGRRYFRKTTADGVRTHHLHAFAAGSPHVARHLAFRDYMNEHPAAARAYGALKRELAAAHPDDMDAYIAGKDAFVRSHEALALAWAGAAARGA